MDKSGNASAASTVVSATRPAVDTTPPAAPTGVVATGGSMGISLTWNANTESDLAGYNIYRSSSATGTFVKLNSNPLTSPKFFDTTVPAGATVYYRIVAVDKAGNASAATLVTRCGRRHKAPSVWLTYSFPGGIPLSPCTQGRGRGMRGCFGIDRPSPSEHAQRTMTLPIRLLRLRPDPRRLFVAEELDVNHVGVAADRAVLDVLLLPAAGAVQRDDDPLPAGRADVRPLVRGMPPPTPTLAALTGHPDILRSARPRSTAMGAERAAGFHRRSPKTPDIMVARSCGGAHLEFHHVPADQKRRRAAARAHSARSSFCSRSSSSQLNPGGC